MRAYPGGGGYAEGLCRRRPNREDVAAADGLELRGRVG
jgi:hypothetical protein